MKKRYLIFQICLTLLSIIPCGVNASVVEPSTEIVAEDSTDAEEEFFGILENAEVHATETDLILETDYFCITLPENISWDYENIDETSFKIYYPPSREADMDGMVVTIHVYDLEDTEYEMFPEYTIVGESETCRYIALFPTDVQFPMGNEEQAKEYLSLLNWVQQMDVNLTTVDNPFSILK